MRRFRSALSLGVSAAVIATVAAVAPAAASSQEGAAGRYIVVLDDSADVGGTGERHIDRFGVDVALVYRHALKGYAGTMTPAAAAALEQAAGVAWVERDKTMRASAQTLPTGIDRAEADLSPTAAIDGTDTRVDVDVAVIDTGVNLSHPDLNVHSAGAMNCTNPITSVEDLNGHGTHVSGTIGALDNAEGVVGMAPGARIWPVKVLTDLGVGLNSHVICGIDYVAANADEIEVANMSLGGAGEDDGNCGETRGDAEHAAICSAVAAGVTFVVAAGNDSEDAKDFVPAAYDEVITVSALSDFDGRPGGAGSPTCEDDQDDTFADFSNFGADIDLIAPGTCIESTWIMGGYDTISGTSMASPHVAGAAALYASQNPGATPAQIRGALQSAGTLDWDNSDDGDSTKERLLNASSL